MWHESMNYHNRLKISNHLHSGFRVNHLDLAPRYASILMGLSEMLGVVAEIAGFSLYHWSLRVPFVVQISNHYHGERRSSAESLQ